MFIFIYLKIPRFSFLLTKSARFSFLFCEKLNLVAYCTGCGFTPLDSTPTLTCLSCNGFSTDLAACVGHTMDKKRRPVSTTSNSVSISFCQLEDFFGNDKTSCGDQRYTKSHVCIITGSCISKTHARTYTHTFCPLSNLPLFASCFLVLTF